MRGGSSGRVACVRRITARTGTLLFVLSAWTALTWLDFLRRLIAGNREHKASFYVAHGVLIVANLVMAGILARVGLRVRRSAALADGGYDARSAGTAAPASPQRSPS